MPYRVEKGGGSCKPGQWAVVKKTTGESVGCHTTKKSALAQLAALHINVTSKESAEEAPMPKPLQETATLSEVAVAEAKRTGRMLVQHISPGWGSSGYYSGEVLEQAVADNLIPAGTHMYADHPTAEEAKARPVRSIKDLMSVTVEDARIATDDDVARGADLGALVSEVDVVPTYRDLLEHLKDSVGVSIRGDGEMTLGEAEGRSGKIIESLAHVQSVDWVTRAGRGGRVLAVVESARAIERAVARGISEATADERRQQLADVIRTTYAGPTTYAWVRDFDETTVWFEASAENEASKTWAQDYTVADDDLSVSLTGTRTEVRPVTKYVPTTRSDSTTPTTEDDQEVTMGNISIEEAEHRRLTEAADRVAVLEQENATNATRIKELEEADATRARRDRATVIVAEQAKAAEVSYTPLEVKGFLAELPVSEDGTLDEGAFTQTVSEDAAARKAAAGSGAVSGFGGTVTEGAGKVTLADIDEAMGLGKDN